MIARRHALRARFRHARMRVANSHLGQFVARQARDPEIRQGVRDLGELTALYYGAKHVTKLHKAFRARRALTGMDVLRQAYEGGLKQRASRSLLRKGLKHVRVRGKLGLRLGMKLAKRAMSRLG
jgi:hypothetical protein